MDIRVISRVLLESYNLCMFIRKKDFKHIKNDFKNIKIQPRLVSKARFWFCS